MGIVLAARAHFPELAPGADARRHPRLRADSRAHASAAARSLAALLAAGRACLSQLSESAQMAAREQTPPRGVGAPGLNVLFDPAHQRGMIRSVSILDLAIMSAPVFSRPEKQIIEDPERQSRPID